MIKFMAFFNQQRNKKTLIKNFLISGNVHIFVDDVKVKNLSWLGELIHIILMALKAT